MTLDCPGCKSKLKLDPAKLPPGASAAVCPKCKTRILLPGTSGAQEISVQCGQCSSRLKVKVAKLKPTASRSKCPKCGGKVDLPAAPAPAGRDSQATRVVSAPAAPPPGTDRSAMTRRLDAKEMGVLMGSQGQPGGAPGEQPIQDDAPPSGAFASSTADLGKLIDEKVDALGSAEGSPPPPAPRIGEPSVEDLPIEMPPPSGEAPAAPAAPGPPPRPASSSSDTRPPAGRARSGSAPTFRTAMPARPRTSPGGKLPALILGGVVGGSVVAAALILGGQFLPEGMAPAVPQAVSDLVGGESLGRLAAMVLLSALAGLLAGLALPPEGAGGGVSIFRCAVAAGLVGLLAGVAIALMHGGGDLMSMILPAASWTVAMILSGLLTGVIARIFASR